MNFKGKTLLSLKGDSRIFAVPSNLVEMVDNLNAKHMSLTVMGHSLGMPGGPSETPKEDFQLLQSQMRAAELFSIFFFFFFFSKVHFIIAMKRSQRSSTLHPTGGNSTPSSSYICRA